MTLQCSNQLVFTSAALDKKIEPILRFFLYLSFLLTSCFAYAQTSAPQKPGLNTKSTQPHVTGPMAMSPAKLQELIGKAESGDAISANELAYYYDVGRRDIPKSLHWFKISAEGGYPIGQYSYGCVLLRKKTNESVTEAIYWLELAQKNGVSAAKYCIADAIQWQQMRDAHP